MRESGILMHITSLPAPYGIGTMGKDAYAFVDFLVRAGQRYWQILPLTPTGYGDSPYQSLGACAGNHYLIDLDRLADEGLLKKEEIQNIPWGSNPARVDFGAMYAHRMNVLRLAFQRFAPDEAYETFVEQNRSWLEDYALFTALKDTLGGKPWLEWPEALRLRKADALAEKRRELSDEIRLQYFVQYEFDRQWKALAATPMPRASALSATFPFTCRWIRRTCGQIRNSSSWTKAAIRNRWRAVPGFLHRGRPALGQPHLRLEKDGADSLFLVDSAPDGCRKAVRCYPSGSFPRL